MMYARSRPRTLAASAFVVATLWSTGSLSAQVSPTRPASASSTSMMTPIAMNTNKDGLALHGYDPVAYFTAGAPAQGQAVFSTTWNGATYRFASAANRDAFVARPEAYAPQYGGYCAMGVAGGAKFDIDPTAWRVENGRLYLNKDARTQNVWLRDVPGNITKADSKWPTVAGKPKR